jgi:hypothetical protein
LSAIPLAELLEATKKVAVQNEKKHTPWWDSAMIAFISFSVVMFPLRIVFFPRNKLMVLSTISLEWIFDVVGTIDRRQRRKEAQASSTYQVVLYEVTLLVLGSSSFVLALTGDLSNDEGLLLAASWLRLPHLWHLLQIFVLIGNIQLYLESTGRGIGTGGMLCLYMIVIMFFFNHFVACGWQFVQDQGFSFQTLDCESMFEVHANATCNLQHEVDGVAYYADSLLACEMPVNAFVGENMEMIVCPVKATQNVLVDYLQAYYFTLVTCTTAGYGDIVPSSDLGTLYVIGMILVGATLYTFIIASITNIAHDVDINENDFGHNMKALVLYMQSTGIPQDLQSKCVKACEFARTKQGCDGEHRVMNADLPLHLKNAMKEYLLVGLVQSSTIFRDCDSGPIKRLVPALTRDFYSPGDMLWDAEDTDHKMFFIKQGQVELLALDGGEGFKPTVLQKVQATRAVKPVGDINLFHPDKFECVVRSLTFCEVYILRKRDLEEVMGDFPDLYTVLEAKADRCLMQGRLARDMTSAKLSFHLGPNAHLELETHRVFPPESDVQFYWDVSTAVAAVFTMFLVPFQLAFLHETHLTVTHLPVMLAADIAVDLLFLVDMKVRMHNFGIHGKDGLPILKSKEFGSIYRHYRFWYDLIASVPLDYFVCILWSANYQLVALFKLNRLLRVRHVVHVLRKLDNLKNLKLDSLVKVLTPLLLHLRGPPPPLCAAGAVSIPTS